MSRRRKTLLITSVILGASIVVAAFIFQHWMNDSSAGTVHVGTPETSSSISTPQKLDISTKYFTTTLPSGFIIKRQTTDPTTSALLQLVANTPSAMNQQFAVTVAPLPAGGISEVGNYRLRTTQAASYAPFTPATLPSGAMAFQTVNGPLAYTVFWPHGSTYAEISLSTDGIATAEQLQTSLNQALSTWQWL